MLVTSLTAVIYSQVHYTTIYNICQYFFQNFFTACDHTKGSSEERKLFHQQKSLEDHEGSTYKRTAEQSDGQENAQKHTKDTNCMQWNSKEYKAQKDF